MKKFVAALSVVILSGCGYTSYYKTPFVDMNSPVVIQVYQGEKKSLESTGLVTTDLAIFVSQIDGKKNDQFIRYGKGRNGLKGERAIYQLEPGTYKFDVCFALSGDQGQSRCRQDVSLALTVVAGDIQIIRYKDVGAKGWMPYLQNAQDLKSDIVSDYKEAISYQK